MRIATSAILILVGLYLPTDAQAGEPYRTEAWTMEVHEEWQAVPRGDQILFVGPTDSCALQISSRSRAAPLSASELERLAGSVVPDSASGGAVDTQPMTGLRYSWIAANTHNTFWFLREGGTFILASYMCAVGEEGEGMEAVEAMIGSLDAT